MCAGVKSLLFASIYPLGMLTLLQWLSASEKSDPCECQLLQSELSYYQMKMINPYITQTMTLKCNTVANKVTAPH